jgi:hypothetical protein
VVVVQNIEDFARLNQGDVFRIISFETRISEKEKIEDLVQDFMLYAVRYDSVGGFRPSKANQNKTLQKAFETWMYTCIMNFLSNKKKSKEYKTESASVSERDLLKNHKESIPDILTRIKARGEKREIYLGSHFMDEEDKRVRTRVSKTLKTILSGREDIKSGTRDRILRVLEGSFDGLSGSELASKEGVSGAYISSLKGKIKEVITDLVPDYLEHIEYEKVKEAERVSVGKGLKADRARSLRELEGVFS